MRIPLFFGDVRIRSRSVPQGRGTDKQANATVQIYKSKGGSTAVDLAAMNNSVSVLNPRPIWLRQEADSAALAHPEAWGSFPPASCPLPPTFIDNLVGLNAVEVFHVRS